MMKEADPTANATALLAAASSPLAGEYAPIVLAAIFGAFCAVRSSELGHLAAFRMMVRCIFTSVAFTGVIAHFVSAGVNHILPEWAAYPTQMWIFPVAFLIAVMGDRWEKVWDAIALGASNFIAGLRPGGSQK